MQLIVREGNNVYTLNFNSFQLEQFDDTFEIWLDNFSVMFQQYTNPVVAQYVFEQICEYINTGKVMILKTEEEYYQEIKDMEISLGMRKEEGIETYFSNVEPHEGECEANVSLCSEHEKGFLRYLPKEYKYISKNKDTNLLVHREKPKKKLMSWVSDDSIFLNVGNRLFTFIKWEDEEPYLIEDLLKE